MADQQTLISPVSRHAAAVAAEMSWIGQIVDARVRHFFQTPDAAFALPDPPQVACETALGHLVVDAGLDVTARLVLGLVLAAEIAPSLLDPFFVRNSAIERIFTEFGGTRTEVGGFVPTIETALFLVAGTQTEARIAAMGLFRADHPLRARAGLRVDDRVLRLPGHRAMMLCDGRLPAPDFSTEFPARRLETALDWDDLVLPDMVRDRIGQILGWIEHEPRILRDWGLARNLGQGFRALFYGPPGTGKTLTAALLGKHTQQPVFRIDLSMVISKYVGETEKNLAAVFDLAAERGWILFFDEADALFGSRSSGANAQDRYANQEVAYLLQRIEDCPGLVILATNLRGNIDAAFFRRFHVAVHFPQPDPAARQRLWGGVLGKDVPLASDVSIEDLARVYELSGGAINNVVRHAAITALRRGADIISRRDLVDAVAAELQKEGRTP
jgi:DNA polymerase III delta prime subunit